jgi:hypothetical protein
LLGLTLLKEPTTEAVSLKIERAIFQRLENWNDIILVQSGADELRMLQ